MPAESIQRALGGVSGAFLQFPHFLQKGDDLVPTRHALGRQPTQSAIPDARISGRRGVA